MNFRISIPLTAVSLKIDHSEPQSILKYIISMRSFANPLQNSALKGTSGNSPLNLITRNKLPCAYNSNRGSY